jgi:hypothetical protein
VVVICLGAVLLCSGSNPDLCWRWFSGDDLCVLVVVTVVYAVAAGFLLHRHCWFLDVFSSNGGFVVALPWSLILPDLLRSAVFLDWCWFTVVVFGYFWFPFKTLSQLSGGLILAICEVWVCLARKGRLYLLCFVIGGCGTWICPCWRSFHSPFLPW